MKKFEGVELTDDMVERNDEIYNEIYELCRVMTDNKELEWDMSIIGELADYAAALLTDRGFRVRFYSIITESDGKEYIETYFTK